MQRFVELGWETSPTPHIALVASLIGDAETVQLLEEMTPWEGVYDVILWRSFSGRELPEELDSFESRSNLGVLPEHDFDRELKESP